MQISFGVDAFDSFVDIARKIRHGYTVALLADGEEIPDTSDFAPCDVSFMGADHYGVLYRRLRKATGEPYGSIRTKTWDQVARIHVY